MKKTVITSIIILLSLSANAQVTTDSTATAFNDSLFQTLPEVMVTGNKPVVKVDGGKLVFDVKQLVKDKPVDNAFDALKHLPGVTPQGDDINLGGMSVALMINGKLTSMSREQVVTLLKCMTSILVWRYGETAVPFTTIALPPTSTLPKTTNSASAIRVTSRRRTSIRR